MSTDAGDGGELTLAFSLPAIERLDDPAAAFEDARRWSRFVGVVDDDRDAVEAAVAEHGLRQDFDLGDRDRWLAMEGIREATHTPRHVHVGATERDRRVATRLGWEFVHVTEAAEKADWALAGAGAGRGVVDRLLAAVPDRLPPWT
jgi:hypothetical protein